MTVGNDGSVETYTAEQLAAIAAERDEAKRLAEEYKTHRDNVVEELKTLRQKKAEAQGEAHTPGDDEVTEKVKAALAAQESIRQSNMRKSLFEKFISGKPEFSKENDVAGLKLAALQKKLARFNLEGLSSEDEIMSAYEDAVRLTIKGSSEGSQTEAPYASTPSGTGATVPPSGDSLTPIEREAINKLGWSLQKYAEMKQKHPALVNSLLNS